VHAHEKNRHQFQGLALDWDTDYNELIMF
jgi:hypothetical protein